MAGVIRVLVASPLAKLYESCLTRTSDFDVVTAVDSDEVQAAISGRVRFDVVLTDLIWDNRESEFSFDAFDVLNALHIAGRLAPVLVASDGRRTEQDHLDEARLRTEVAGIYVKASGPDALRDATRTIALGHREPVGPKPPRSLYELFCGRKGETAGRLAGSIAAGRASDAATLGLAAHVALNTANKVTTQYLGPIIVERNEHDPTLPMTLPAIYRWCGLHAHYLISWCRRNGHTDVVRPFTL